MPRYDPIRPSNLKLFDHAEDWWHNATLNTGGAEWSEIAEGYRDAADIVVDNHRDAAAALDWIAFPIVFLYRQYLELSMKALLIDAGNLLDRPENPGKSHSLNSLWERLRPLLEEISPGESHGFLDNFGQRIQEFESIDPGSYSFRYPMDNHGRPTLPPGLPVNVRQIKTVIEELAILVDGGGAMISDYEGFKHGY